MNKTELQNVGNAPTTMSRKTFLRLTLGTAAAVSFAPLTGCSKPGRKLRFASIDDALAETALIETNLATVQMQQPWSLYKVLEHMAQSMEYSMTGYPQMESGALMTAGRFVFFNVFKPQGYMSHDLGAPVPGAPDIADDGPLEEAFLRYRNACNDFQNFTGAVMPHFTYGELSYEDWVLAHAFHAADHYSSLTYETVSEDLGETVPA
jgi:hypothetical protein